ncbi:MULTISPECIES: nitroreductase [unclassified Xanthobacter]|uniref:nitroreductase n=1 Tax=unclassified Xanthobacter TaxID=2623496 RepID=UPI001EDE2A69|nr:MULTISPECIES: nitroreductase [unclassified Xanthobacter]
MDQRCTDFTPAPPTSRAAPMSALDAIGSRRAVRAFLPTAVAPETIDRILEIAARAPSGTNMQPWQVWVLTGAPLAALSQELVARARAGESEQPAYAYYPKQWREPYLSRRRKVGWDLYGALNIGRSDAERMSAQHARNFCFFDAPVGLIFTIDRDLELGSWLDYGMFLENIMVAARAFGLDTCPQAAFIHHASIIAHRLAIPDEQMLVCGMALGHADPNAPENRFATVREPLSAFVRRVEHLVPDLPAT